MSDHDKIPIDTPLVQRLIAEQFPQRADLEIKPVELSGSDNKTFHLGAHMTVRLPKALSTCKWTLERVGLGCEEELFRYPEF